MKFEVTQSSHWIIKIHSGIWKLVTRQIKYLRFLLHQLPLFVVEFFIFLIYSRRASARFTAKIQTSIRILQQNSARTRNSRFYYSHIYTISTGSITFHFTTLAYFANVCKCRTNTFRHLTDAESCESTTNYFPKLMRQVAILLLTETTQERVWQ